MLAYRSTRQVLSIPSVLVLICMTNFTILFQKCKLVNQHFCEIATKQKSMTLCTMNTIVYRHVHDIMEWRHWQQMWSWPWLQVWLPLLALASSGAIHKFIPPVCCYNSFFSISLSFIHDFLLFLWNTFHLNKASFLHAMHGMVMYPISTYHIQTSSSFMHNHMQPLFFPLHCPLLSYIFLSHCAMNTAWSVAGSLPI